MKSLILFSIHLTFLLPVKTFASNSNNSIDACLNFKAGQIDAHKTLEILDLDINNYSIGVNNTAKIFCS